MSATLKTTPPGTGMSIATVRYMMSAKTPPLAALVYRSGKGCRQYAFETADDLAKWAARHTYKNENLRVIVVKNRTFIGETWTPAASAADFVRNLLERQQ